MSAETALRARLAAHTPLTALVGTRIRAARAEQNDSLPFVVFTRSATEPLACVDGTVLGGKATLEVQCWAATAANAETVAGHCITAVAGLGQLTNRSNGHDPDLDLEAVLLTFEVWE